MNIRIVLILFTLQTASFAALGSAVSQTICSDRQTNPSISETLSLNSSGDELYEWIPFAFGDNGVSSGATSSTTSSLKFHKTTPIVVLTASHPVSALDNLVASTTTIKPNPPKISADNDLLVLIALILIAMTLLSVALVLWFLIRKYQTENRRSVEVA